MSSALITGLAVTAAGLVIYFVIRPPLLRLAGRIHERRQRHG